MRGPNILIVHAGHTSDGSTATLAGWIRDGAATRHGAVAVVKEASTATLADVQAADALILGSPTINGSPAPAMSTFLDVTLEASPQHGADLSAVVGAGFCTSAAYVTGAQPTLFSMQRSLLTLGATIVGSGSWRNSSGVCGLVTDASATHPLPDGKTWEFTDITGAQKYLEEDCKAFGARVADVGSFFKTGYTAATGAPAQPGTALTCAGRPEDPLTRLEQGQRQGQMLNAGLWIIGVAILLTVILALGLRKR